MSDHEEESIVPHVRYLPLNSKRMTTAHFKQVAHALSLPTVGAADQLYQMIDGKLETDGHDTK